MLNFEFLWKRLGQACSPRFAYEFSRKMFLMLHSINWSNLIVWLSLLFEILSNTCNVVVWSPVCDVIAFGINFRFQIKRFLTWPKNAKTKNPKNPKHLVNEEAFYLKLKAFHITLKGVLLKQIKPTFLEGESPTLTTTLNLVFLRL